MPCFPFVQPEVAWNVQAVQPDFDALLNTSEDILFTCREEEVVCMSRVSDALGFAYTLKRHI